MIVGKCKICGENLSGKPSLILRNMPSRAQFLPLKKDLQSDKGIDLQIFECRFCGVIQLKNKPVDYYRSVIRSIEFSKEMITFRKQYFAQFVNRFSLKRKKIIEIGCGRGEFLSILKETGVFAYGIEYDKNFVNECCEKGLRVSKDFIENSNHILKSAPFDGFVMFNYLEHLPDPCGSLRGIYNNLKEDAVGIVEVPNFDLVLRKKLLSEFMLDHLFYFTKDSLKTVLNISGFDILECNAIWHDYIISAIVKKKKGKLDPISLLKYMKKISSALDEYLSKFADKSVAIWGAGHQSFAVLCFLKLLKKIKYVVDSAPFKQGKYTPVTHIQIVPPEMLNLDSPDAIVVMAGSYSDEVARIIKKKYKNLNFIVLKD